MASAAGDAATMFRDDLVPFKLTLVMYSPGDALGLVLAVASLSPMCVVASSDLTQLAAGTAHSHEFPPVPRRFIMVVYATLVVSRRDVRTIALAAGQVRCSAGHRHRRKRGDVHSHQGCVLTLWRAGPCR